MGNGDACMELEPGERDLRAHGRLVIRLLTAAVGAFSAQVARRAVAVRRVCEHSMRVADQTGHPLAGRPEAVWHEF